MILCDQIASFKNIPFLKGLGHPVSKQAVTIIVLPYKTVTLVQYEFLFKTVLCIYSINKSCSVYQDPVLLLLKATSANKVMSQELIQSFSTHKSNVNNIFAEKLCRALSLHMPLTIFKYKSEVFFV